MAWPKGKKRGTKAQQAARKQPKPKPMGPPPSREMAFYLERIEDLEHKGRGLYIGRCPKCGRKELRVFDEDPIEIRCAKCRFWAYGADQFAKFTEKIKVEVEMPCKKGKKGKKKFKK